jgi:hypothetical protein
LAKREKDTKR